MTKRILSFWLLITCTWPILYSQTLRIALVGDIMPGTTFPTNRLPQNGGRDLFREADSLLRGADIAIGNLEGALCEPIDTTLLPPQMRTDIKEQAPNNYSFRIPPSYAPLLKDAGFDFLCLANNHTRDFGAYGYKRAMHVLDSIGMPYAGIKGRPAYSIIRRNGMRIGVCAFGQNSYCNRHQDTAFVAQVLEEMRPKCDILIVSMHGGAEGVAAAHLPDSTEVYLGENRGRLREFAHFCIDHGADLIHGHGPHVPRAVELYKDRFIAYSLGNFCTPFGFSLKGMCGHAPLIEVELQKDGSFLRGQIHSYVQRYGKGPTKDPAQAAVNDIRHLTEEDIPHSGLTIDANGAIRR